MRVLIVDDSLLAEHAIKSYFTKLGHEVVGMSKTGEAALEAYKNESSIDIVTVDAIMPGMSGPEFIKELNQYNTSTGRKPKIIMISSEQISNEVRLGITVDKYLVKPITLDKIEVALREL